MQALARGWRAMIDAGTSQSAELSLCSSTLSTPKGGNKPGTAARWPSHSDYTVADNFCYTLHALGSKLYRCFIDGDDRST